MNPVRGNPSCFMMKNIKYQIPKVCHANIIYPVRNTESYHIIAKRDITQLISSLPHTSLGKISNGIYYGNKLVSLSR